jgi:thiol-disulfide isomerase/thioredoxin
MKRILSLAIFILCATFFTMAQQKDGFTIRGTVKGEAEGARVYLRNEYVSPIAYLDSTVIHNGAFFLKGKVAKPAFYSLVIDANDPKAEEKDYHNKMFRYDFYVENSEMTIDADLNTMSSYFWNPKRKGVPVIKGSATQDLLMKYRNQVRVYSRKLSVLDSLYSHQYIIPQLDGKNVTARGIELVNEMKPLQKENDRIENQFMRENIGNVVGYDLLMQKFTGMYVPLTVKEIDELLLLADKSWHGTSEMKALNDAAAKSKKMAVGQKIIDGEFLNLKGQKVRLSSLIPKGKYVMLEFWASWCSPCRGEIPHLKKVHEKYKNFTIISVSVDSRDADWKKAVKEEKMSWIQLRNAKGMGGIILNEYNILGVPTCIVLDKQGRIYKTDMRGAFLDDFLKETYHQ